RRVPGCLPSAPRGRRTLRASLSLGAFHPHYLIIIGRHRMSGTIVERIDELDNKQAIFQVKLLLQNIVNTNPQIGALDDAAIAAELKAIDTDTSGAFAEAAEILRTGPTKSLPSKEAGATAREMLRTFAATEDGEAILASSLEKKDVSADLG